SFFADSLERYIRRYRAYPIHQETVDEPSPTGFPVPKPVIIIYQVGPLKQGPTESLQNRLGHNGVCTPRATGSRSRTSLPASTHARCSGRIRTRIQLRSVPRTRRPTASHSLPA